MLVSLKKLVALLTRHNRRTIVILFGLMIAGSLLEVVGIAAIPIFVSTIVDPSALNKFPALQEFLATYQMTDKRELVLWGALILIVVFGIKNGFLVFSFYWQMVFVKNRRIELSRSLTHAYMGAPYTFHLTHNTSEIMSNIDREVTLIANQVITPILEIATRFLMLLGILVFLFAVEPLITLFWLLAFSLIGVLGIVALSTKLKLFGLEEQQNRRRFVKALYQGFGIIKEARILNRESFFSKQIVETVSRMAKTLAFKQFATKAVPPVTEFAALTSLLCLVVGLILLGRSTESILITLSLFIVGLIRMRETISAAMAHFATLRYSIVSIDPVYNDLKYLESRSKTSHLESAATPQPYHMHQQIELRDVSYRYDGAPHDALKDINLVIPAGSAVGFVGSTGAGKSTIVDTILGLLDPVKGGVFVDGRDIRERGIDSWQATIGYVPQSIYLLDDTIRRNIALGISDDEIDERAVWNALKAAQLENFVNHHPAGLDSVVGEQGVRLSGGERQRIGIARALYHDPDVLILDEATSSLDAATERSIAASVEELKGRRTIIMIAHRLSTVRKCDMLYFLKDGKIEAHGDYDELQVRHPDFKVMATI